ncbi:hypothetical protein K523DRAFT_420354 [Schizophyllum commune Tattone D]|nr:hypothetical protein K523DRAFT_420354 [Schizophyllum commune Tattone D]
MYLLSAELSSRGRTSKVKVDLGDANVPGRLWSGRCDQQLAWPDLRCRLTDRPPLGDEDDATLAEVPPSPCPGPRSGIVLSLPRRADEEGDELLHINISVVADGKNKRRRLEMDDETLMQDADSDSKDARRAEKK